MTALTDAQVKALEMLESGPMAWDKFCRATHWATRDSLAENRLVGCPNRGWGCFEAEMSPAGRAALAEWREAKALEEYRESHD